MKIKHKILVNSLLLLMAIGGVSCKKYLDVNENPLTSTTIEPKLLFGYAITAWDVSKNSGDSYIAIGFIGQTLASGANFSDNWGPSNLYNLSTNILGNTWKVYYSTAGNNLKQAIIAAEAANPVNNNAAAQCKIVLAQMMLECTTMYGDIPFKEAWDPVNFPYPKYDAQKDVFESILSLLDEAKAQIDPASSEKISDYDIFYNGEMSDWTKLANSIKFKTLMIMVDKDPSKAAAIGALASDPASMINSADKTWLTPYSGNPNNENPKYRLFKQDNPFTYANKLVTDIMVPQNDPRLPKYFDIGPAATTYIGIQSEADADATTSLLSFYLRRKDAPSVILSYQELLFLEAEVYARGLGVPQNLVTAQVLFKKGIQTAMEFYEADPAQIDLYLNGKPAIPAIPERPAVPATPTTPAVPAIPEVPEVPAIPPKLVDLTTAADPVKEIHIQQWVDLMDRPLEAFVQWRRSGPEGSEVPVMTLPIGATPGPLIRRFTLSPEELAANPNIPVPQPKYFDKLWFDL